MTLVCLVKLNHIFHMVQVHSTELTRIPQALLSTGEIRITWLDYSRSCMKKLLNRRLVKFSLCVHYARFCAWFRTRKYSLNAFGQNLHSPRSDMKNAAVPALMFAACAIRLSWMRCWISPKNHSLCNCNCHSFSLPIKRFSSPTGLVLQDSGCLHFKNSPLFIFKRRKRKERDKGSLCLSSKQNCCPLQISRNPESRLSSFVHGECGWWLKHSDMEEWQRRPELLIGANKKTNSVLVPAFKQGCSFLPFYCNFVSFCYDQ